MGFNIKNNYGPNIEVNAGGKVTLVQGKDGLWHTAEGEEAYYEEIKEDGTLQPAPTEEQRIDNSQERNEELFHFVHPELERSFGHLVICQNRKQMLSKRHYNININIYIIVSK